MAIFKGAGVAIVTPMNEDGSVNYEKFGEYYKKAQELYLAQLDNNVNDMEMQRLEELYDQAVQNGWLN